MREEKKEYIAEVLGEIDDKYIAEAAVSIGKIVKFRWKHWMTAASVCACLLIAFLSVWALPFLWSDVGKTGMGVQTETNGKGVTIPEVQVSLSKNNEETYNMLPFVIYQGGVYMQNNGISQDDMLAGKYLGHATGLIDEWTADDGYIDFAGSVEGEIYSVDGLDDSFAIALVQHEKDGSNRTILLAKNNGITLEKGSDLYEERLHLAENYSSVQYQAGYAWYIGNEEEKKVLDASYEGKISALVDALNEGTVMLRKDIEEAPELSEDTDWSNNMEFVLYFRLKSGIVIPLYIMQGGYVIYSGMPDVCVKIPENIQEGFWSVPGSSGNGGNESQAKDAGRNKDVGVNESAGQNGNSGENGNAGNSSQTGSTGNTGGKKNGSKTGDQGNSDVQTNEKGKDEQEGTEDVCWIQKAAELEVGKESTVCLYARQDYTRPYIVIREGKTEQKISLGKSKDLWYHDMPHSEIITEHDFDEDGTKDIVVLFRQGASTVLSEFRMLKRDSSGNWKIFTLPEQIDLENRWSYVKIKADDDNKVQIKVPATGYKKKLDLSDHPSPDIASYFAKQGKKTLDGTFVQLTWYGSELVMEYHFSAGNSGDEVGTIKQKILWDKEKSCFVLGETWYEETAWEYPGESWEGE